MRIFFHQIKEILLLWMSYVVKDLWSRLYSRWAKWRSVIRAISFEHLEMMGFHGNNFLSYPITAISYFNWSLYKKMIVSERSGNLLEILICFILLTITKYVQSGAIMFYHRNSLNKEKIIYGRRIFCCQSWLKMRFFSFCSSLLNVFLGYWMLHLTICNCL